MYMPLKNKNRDKQAQITNKINPITPEMSTVKAHTGMKTPDKSPENTALKEFLYSLEQ
jgi:hypothetical protein